MIKETFANTWLQNTNTARAKFIDYKINPKHKIKLKTLTTTIQIVWKKTIVAKSQNCIEMLENKHAPIIYFPMNDIYDEFFIPSSQATYCPYKGDAAYWSLRSKTEEAANAVWSYPTPVHALLPIMHHRAFYLDSMGANFGLQLNIIQG